MDAYFVKAGNQDLGGRGRGRAAGAAPSLGRLLARLRAGKLDRALAAGVSPESSRALAIHAEALPSPKVRRALGDAVEELLAQRREPHRLGSRVSPRRERVEANRDELDTLARRLRADQRTDARGVARVRELLSDGAGPLFWDGSREDLGTTIRAAIAALEPELDLPRTRETR
jgi:hypothetical protein